MKESNIRERMSKLLNKMREGIIDKDESTRLALLCAVAGENIFFMGPPGTAKSMISSRLHKIFKEDTKYFEFLMSKYSAPEEIFGPIKLEGLDRGVYKRRTDGYLPTAHIAFLDEIWKSGNGILNSLLTIINEKKFRNGPAETEEELSDEKLGKYGRVPLQICLAASNEFPASGLSALYDRFTVRTFVNPVKTNNDLFKLCMDSFDELDVSDVKDILLNVDEIKEWQNEIKKIGLPQEIQEVIVGVRQEMNRLNEEQTNNSEKYYVSDRRWKKIVHLLQTSAYLCGRNDVDLMDCQLISYCIWDTARQFDEAKTIIEKIVREHGVGCGSEDVQRIEDKIASFEADIDSRFYKKNEVLEFVTANYGDGSLIYKLKSPIKIDSYEEIHYFSRDCEKLFNKNRKRINNLPDSRIVNRTWQKDDFSFDYQEYYGSSRHFSSKLETKNSVDELGKLVKNEALFENISEYAKQRRISEESAKAIEEEIKTRMQKLKDFRDNVEKTLKENLFAEPSFKASITGNIDAVEKGLEDALDHLGAQRNRYSNPLYESMMADLRRENEQ
ncbi:MAG: AAA family ATPase [Treponema sp.]|nr:AAA family ATPase [Treponema sp.]